MMEIQQEENAKGGNFFVEIDGSRKAEMAYRMVNSHTMNIIHTNVDEELQGKHIGQQLVKKGVEFARQNSFKVKADCSFAHEVLQRTADYKDVFVSS